jgi:hypothetical protein
MTRLSRFRHAVAGIPLVVAVTACTPATPTDTETIPVGAASTPAPSTAPPAATPSAPSVRTEATLGTYTVGDTRVTLVDALVIPGEAGHLKILYTPTVLSNEERQAVLAKPEWPGMALMQKTGGEFPDRYPYVVATFRYEGTPELQNMRSFHLLAYGIHEANYTDNVNGPVNDFGYRLERLQVKGDRVSLAFSGKTTFGDVERSWSLDTPY